ncbi:hypothetical protein F7725_009013 [Dissostichus mawsoni]|uniref:Secreted protein n=1 Tax=Dissostichus mawsoni TaxID=36200 RepID=A0A7J5Z5Q7_DISMA|nr:hypothetical protein F7725_009013 [Dissostichus mawsoni]
MTVGSRRSSLCLTSLYWFSICKCLTELSVKHCFLIKLNDSRKAEGLFCLFNSEETHGPASTPFWASSTVFFILVTLDLASLCTPGVLVYQC